MWGYIACIGDTNIMPGAAWFQTVDEAKDAIDILNAVGGKADDFWKVWNSRKGTRTLYATLVAIEHRLKVAVVLGSDYNWKAARGELERILGSDYWGISPCVEQPTKAAGYFVFSSVKNAWLQADERTWGRFVDAVQFPEFDFACSIAVREAPTLKGVGILAWIDPVVRS